MVKASAGPALPALPIQILQVLLALRAQGASLVPVELRRARTVQEALAILVISMEIAVHLAACARVIRTGGLLLTVQMRVRAPQIKLEWSAPVTVNAAKTPQDPMHALVRPDS